MSSVTAKETRAPAPAPGRSGGWLTLPRLWVVVALGGITLMQLAARPGAIDLAYHVRTGALMLGGHGLLRHDVFAWPTASARWLDQNWGAQLVLYGLWRRGGFPLVTVANAALTLAGWALVAAACRRRTANLRVIAGALLAGYASSAFVFSPRPQMLSVPLFAAELYLLEVARSRPRAAFAIPLLMLVWANVHGAFTMGLVLVALEAAAALWGRDLAGVRRMLLVGVASLAALLVNPWGIGVLRYAVAVSTNPTITRGVTEWTSPSLRSGEDVGFFAGLAVLGVAVARRGVASRAADQLIRIVPLAVLALWTSRAELWFGLALPIALCTLARERPGRPAAADRGSPLLTGLVLLALAAALTVAMPSVRGALLRDRPALQSAPVAAAEWLAAHPQPGRMYNYQPWGSYLEFRLGPRVQVAADSRIELYSRRFWADYAAITAGRYDAERLLRRDGVTYVVTSAKQTPGLVGDLESSGAWRPAFAAGEQRIYVRRSPLGSGRPATGRP